MPGFVNRGPWGVIRRKCHFSIDSTISRFLALLAVTLQNHTSIHPYIHTTRFQMCKFTAPRTTILVTPYSVGKGERNE